MAMANVTFDKHKLWCSYVCIATVAIASRMI